MKEYRTGVALDSIVCQPLPFCIMYSHFFILLFPFVCAFEFVFAKITFINVDIGKAQLSPSLYFYGELELVRTQSRDRNIDDGGRSASSAGSAGTGPGTEDTGTSKMRSQIGPTRPQYIEEYQKLAKLQHLLGKAKAKIEAKGKEGHGIGRKRKGRSAQKDKKKMMKMKKAI